MTHFTKKQRQEQFLEAFLRAIGETSPGERVYWAVDDLFEVAEVHDLADKRRRATGSMPERKDT